MRYAAWFGLVLCAGAALAAASRPPLGEQTLQLRVIGASNLPAAQRAKLAVRDVVLAAVAPAVAGAPSASAAEAALVRTLPEISAAATAAAARFGEGASVTLGPAPLPARRLGVLSFAAQRRPALIVTLGAGRGHNWWTVLFPPLTLVTVGGRLIVVGPAGAAEPVPDLDPAQRQALLAWVSGKTGVPLDSAVETAGPGTPAGARVQVEFLLWNLARDLPGVRAALARL